MAVSYLDILSASEVFAGIEQPDIQKMLRCTNATIRSYSKNDILVHKGEVIKKVYLVLEGQLKTFLDGSINHANIIEKVKPGRISGTAFCATREPTHFSLAAMCESVVLELDYAKLISRCAQNCPPHDTVLDNMMRVLSGKVVLLSEKIDYVHIKSLRQKLITYLLNNYEKNGRKDMFYIDMSRTELAEYFGVSRPSMTRELSNMQAEGLIEFHLNCFRIIDHTALTRELDGD